MINQTLLSFFAMMTLFSTNMYSFLIGASSNADATEETTIDTQSIKHIENIVNRLFVLLNGDLLDFDQEEAIEEEEQAVTTMVTSVEAIEEEPAEPELTDEEKQLLALKEWEESFPTYDSDAHQTEFIETIAPAAVLIANTHGIYPSVMIAQASLESSWGQSGLAQNYNNLMGTKGSWNGKSVTVSTREDVNGQSVYINAGFSVYDSWADSLNRYGLLMKNGLKHDNNFYSGTWRANTQSYRDATAWLQGRYATDTLYADKLNQTIESFNLDRYDEIESFDFQLDESLAEINLGI